MIDRLLGCFAKISGFKAQFIRDPGGGIRLVSEGAQAPFGRLTQERPVAPSVMKKPGGCLRLIIPEQLAEHLLLRQKKGFFRYPLGFRFR